MGTPNNPGEEQETLPCDYCHNQIALLFCRADSAKLCLFCDNQVHAANALSGKHLRSQICDGCRSAPVSFRCSTDNLLLCRECDWDAHGLCSASALHDRTPIEGFTGCPSPLELASTWGFDLNHYHTKPTNNPLHDSGHWEYPLADPNSWMQEVMVPESDESDVFKKSTFSFEKQKNVILKQLTELSKRSVFSSDGNGGRGQQQKEEEVPFTSLLMMKQGRVDVDRIDDQTLQHSMLWNSIPGDRRGTQIWDFDMERSASPDRNNGGFMSEDHKTGTGLAMNLKIQNSSKSCFGTQKGYDIGIGGSDDIEILARNRGNAMLRYLEKKKSRRYVKHIRYESRKARAHTRKRIKGRFVKADNA
ncbi:unnamed protein product [Lactuca saligna]|uniref:Uncharacterized protein n=1 Tax=Lactuca saligna TaxID=75948 RepID=A0AA36ENI8_LACSI|nr:unnamed protein product [Lactuca saligna]